MKRLKPNGAYSLFALAVIGIAGAWFLWLRFGILHFAEQTAKLTGDQVNMSSLGQAGDMFGGLNTLFAGLAFAFVAIAAYFQQRALASAHDQQRLAEFEPLFFRLLEMFRELQRDARITADNIVPGRALDSENVKQHFRAMAQWAVNGSSDPPMSAADQKILMVVYYEKTYQANEHVLAPMFRTLYHTFRLIAHSGLTDKEQVRYANIARGLLSGDFLMLLMLNCLSPHGKGFAAYVEYFGLLKHIRFIKGDGCDEKVAKFFEPTALLSHPERLKHWKGVPPVLQD